jgi:hypothetical protein
VTFKHAVQRTPSIAQGYLAGLQALSNVDRARVTATDTRLLTGSLDLDTSLKASRPADPRWDYGIGYKRNREPEQIFWIEIHPARTTTHLVEVEKKLRWPKEWLDNDGALLCDFRREFVWVSSGATAYTQNSRQTRRLAQAGLQLRGRHFNIS